jgi:hypothetical protein
LKLSDGSKISVPANKVYADAILTEAVTEGSNTKTCLDLISGREKYNLEVPQANYPKCVFRETGFYEHSWSFPIEVIKGNCESSACAFTDNKGESHTFDKSKVMEDGKLMLPKMLEAVG